MLRVSLVSAVILTALPSVARADLIAELGTKDDFWPHFVGAGNVEGRSGSLLSGALIIGGDGGHWLWTNQVSGFGSSIGLGEDAFNDPLRYQISRVVQGTGSLDGSTFWRLNTDFPTNGWALDALQGDIQVGDEIFIGAYGHDGVFRGGQFDTIVGHGLGDGATVAIRRNGESFFAGLTSGDSYIQYGGERQWNAVHSTVVPEPSSFSALMVVGSLLALRRRRRVTNAS